jgi:hypothetical protein
MNTFNNPATASLLLLSIIIAITITIAQEDVGGEVMTQLFQYPRTTLSHAEPKNQATSFNSSIASTMVPVAQR